MNKKNVIALLLSAALFTSSMYPAGKSLSEIFGTLLTDVYDYGCEAFDSSRENAKSGLKTAVEATKKGYNYIVNDRSGITTIASNATAFYLAKSFINQYNSKTPTSWLAYCYPPTAYLFYKIGAEAHTNLWNHYTTSKNNNSEKKQEEMSEKEQEKEQEEEEGNIL